MVRTNSDGLLPIEIGRVYRLGNGRLYRVLAMDVEPPSECFWTKLCVIQRVMPEERNHGVTRLFPPVEDAKCISQEHLYDAINEGERIENEQNKKG